MISTYNDKLKPKHRLFEGLYLDKYKIRSIITYTDTDTEFDINLEDANEHVYYSFSFSINNYRELDDEFYTYKWGNKLFSVNYEDIDVEVMREELGHDVFDGVRNLASFLLKNGFISY